MATALLTINANGQNALATIAQIQQALNNLQNNANLNIGGNGGGPNQQMAQMQRGIQELTSLTNSWAAAITRNVTSALRSAFQEIQHIDDQLVTIRRVTGRTGAELNTLTARATDVAKTYGTAASDYLASVASFSKAGYGGAADALGELSVKAQRVGDLTQEVADQFLLAVDKGYQFGGSIEQLSAVLDGANEIGNRFATDVDKIAQGLGKVAPIANQAHVSIYELEAALGTITAVTQRSGTEAATALRALFLNIMGDTKTEIEDGAKWTAGEIEGLQDLLKIYASDVVEAAQKTGEVINPMEAIAALSKAYREGVLTEQAMVSMVSDIGGKLRTTQLLALIQNWDMYTKMVETATTATGSADKEIANSLDSITVKINQLRATWVDMVSDTVNSRLIKDMIDFGTHALESFGGLVPLLSNIAGIVLTLRGYRIAESIKGIFSGLAAGGLSSFVSGIGLATTAVTAFMTVINSGNNAARQQIAGFAKTATEAANTSDSIYDLYMQVREAVPGTDEYTSALARLAAQMQLTGEDARNLAGNVGQYTKEALQKAALTAQMSYNELSAKLNDPNIFSNAFMSSDSIAKGIFGSYRVNIENESKAVQKIIAKNLKMMDMGDWNFNVFKGKSSPQLTIEEVIERYEALIAAREELALYGEENNINNIAETTVYRDLVSSIELLQEAYDQASASAHALADANANLAMLDLTESGTADAWWQFNDDIASGAKVSQEAIGTTLKSMVEFAESFNDGTLKGRYLRDSIVQRLGQQFPELTKQIKEWSDIIGQSPKSGAADTADKTTESVKQLTDALSEATKAKNEFDKAMDAGEENESFQNYKEAYDLYAQEMEAGRVNSRKSKAAARYLLGDEKYNAAYSSGGYKAVHAAMKSSNLDLLYGEESGDYAEGFFKYLTKYANSVGEIVNSNNEVVASMSLVGDEVDFTIKSIEGLADVTGLSVGQIGAAVDALGVYGDITFQEIENLKKYLTEAKEGGTQLQGISQDAFGNITVDYEKFKSQFSYSDFLTDQWQSLKYYLNMANELGQIDLTNVTEGWLEADDAMERAAQTAQSDMEEQKAKAEEMKTESQAAAEEAEAAANAAREAAAGVQAEMKAIAEASGEAQTKIATINETISAIRETLGSEAADAFMTSLQESAQAAGGEVVIADGAVTELKGKGDTPMTWQMLSDLISQAGNCEAKLDELGGKILGLDDDLPELTIKIDPNDEAGTKIETIGKGATDMVNVQRTMRIGAEEISAEFTHVKDDAGDIVEETKRFKYGAEKDQTWTEEINTVIKAAEDPTNAENTNLKFKYGADGELESTSVETVKTKAGEVTENKLYLFHYGADGTLDNASVTAVQNAADGVTKTTKYEFSYGINGELSKANELTLLKDAKGVTNGVEYKFEYGTDDHLIESSKTEIRQTADGVVNNEVERKFVYGANGEPLKEELTTNIKPLANGATEEGTDKRTFYYTASGDRLPLQIDQIVQEANGAVKKVTQTTFHYDAAWNLTGKTVDEISKEADGVLKERTVEFGANGQVVSDTVSTLTGEIGDLVGPNTDKNIVFQADGDKVIQTIGDIEDAIANAQEKARSAGSGLVPTREGPEESDDGWSYTPVVERGEEDAWDRAQQMAIWGKEQMSAGMTREAFLAQYGGQGKFNEYLLQALGDYGIDVEVNATGEAGEVSGIIDANGETVKLKADITAKGDTEDITNALRGDEDDEAIITKEVDLQMSDGAKTLIDGLYTFMGDDGIDTSLSVTTDANGDRLFELIETGGNLPEAIRTEFTVTGDGYVKIKEIKENEEGIPEEKTTVLKADTATANSRISSLLSRLNQLRDKTVTVNAKVGATGKTGTTTTGTGLFSGLMNMLGIKTNAKGSSYFAGGLSLINEEGPELVTAEGWAQILGDGEPTIADIPRGASIYTAEETARMLGGINGKGTVFPAFASGLTGLLDSFKSTPLGKVVDNAAKAVGTVANAFGEFLRGNTGASGNVTLPSKKKTEEETKKTTTSSGGSAKKEESDFWDVIQKYIEYGLKKIQYQIDERQEAIAALERERDKLFKPLDADISDFNWEIEEAEYRIKLIERQRDDATKGLKDQIDALKEARDIEQDQEQIEEKRLAVLEAENALRDAQYDRTVRYYNESTGQWEWMADQSAVKNAQDALKDAQEAYEDALADYQITQLERQVESIEKMYAAQAKPYEDQVEQYSRKVEDLQYQRDKIEKQYADSIDPLQNALDDLQQTYDELEKYYGKIQDAIAVPTEDLDAALAQMTSAEEVYSSQTGNVQSLLDKLYDLAPTWSAISAGTLGISKTAGAISNTNFNDVLNKTSGDTIIINGLTVSGDRSMSLNELINKAGIYRNYDQ